MVSFENITQERFDRFKIFLISNFNLTFQQSEKSSIVESFEISLNDGKLLGNYNSDLSLDISPSTDSLNFDEINAKINDFLKQEKEDTSEKPDSDSKAQSLMIKEYANNSKKFYEHILSCEVCRLKLAEIWKHLYQ